MSATEPTTIPSAAQAIYAAETAGRGCWNLLPPEARRRYQAIAALTQAATRHTQGTRND